MGTTDSTPRKVRFELHIRPLMRYLDHAQMLLIGHRSIDLFDYDQVKDKASAILERVRSGSMPPSTYGGPWPPEWVALFARWVEEGCGRLDVWQADSYEPQWKNDLLTLKARGMAPDISTVYSIWIDQLHGGVTPREYILYLNPTEPWPDQPQPYPFETREIAFIPDPAEEYIVVHDKAGRHQIPIPPKSAK
jgi:hypothetical protein